MEQSYTCTCMHLPFEWSRDSALVLQILHIQFSPVLVMSWTVVIVDMNWFGISAKKSFCIYQSTTWLGRNRILVVLGTIIFLSKVQLCKSCLKTCNWFVVWPRMTSDFFHLLSHFLRLEKVCSWSFFFFLPLNPHLRVISIKFILVIAMLCKKKVVMKIKNMITQNVFAWYFVNFFSLSTSIVN